MMKYFIPKGNYFFTPLLIYSNVVVFVLMVIGGANVFSPDDKTLVDWGANYSPFTLNGEPWRLLTSTFVHSGIAHLAMNMIMLFQVGVILSN